MTLEKPFAAFDIDGTIIRWQLYHAVVEQFGKRGLISNEQYQAIKDARRTWKCRTGDTSFRDYERVLVTVHDEALRSLTYGQYMNVIEHVIAEYRDQTYVYTRDLIRSLQQQDYLLFAISGSQHEIVEILARYYGFDDWAGSRYERSGEQFTGGNIPLKRDKKPEVLRQMVEKHGAVWQGSIAVGDSDSDIPMLETAQQPIAFNPNKDLYRYAVQKGWKIVVERKNMYYELEPGHGQSYLVAQTNA